MKRKFYLTRHLDLIHIPIKFDEDYIKTLLSYGAYKIFFLNNQRGIIQNLRKG